MNIQKFDQFGTEVIDIFQLDESKSMAKYGLDEFKNIFRGPLLESDGFVDELLLEKAHVCYEMSMLTEAKSHWFDTPGEILKIDAEDHTILIKNNEAYIVATSTLNAVNEFWSWSDAKSAWNSFSSKVTNYAKEKVQQAKTVAVKAWDTISDGAKKAWEFVKSCAAAVVKFVKEMTWVEWASLGIGVLTAIAGLLGSGPVPGLTVVAGILMCLNGGIHLYEGYHKYEHAKETLQKYTSLEEISKTSAAVVQALPNIAFGSTFMVLGFYDISHGLTEALANPAAGSVSAGIKSTAHNVTKSYVGKLGHNIEKIMGGFIKEALENMGKKITAKAAGIFAYNLIAIFGEVVISKVLGWLWKGLLKLSKSVLSGIEFLLDLPAKITSGITTIQKNATSTIGKIVAKGLGTLVKPMSESAAKVINKYIKPTITKAKAWLDRQIVAYDVCEKLITKHHSELGEGESVPETKGKALMKGKELQADPKDLKKLEKLPKINKDIQKAASSTGYDVKRAHKNESSAYNLKHLTLFEGFDPIV